MSGKIFYGKSEDGSDAKEFEGVYINPNNPNEWSNLPYNKKKDVYIIEPSPMMHYDSGKEWVCKGKHQYREVTSKEGSLIKTKWVCQCGRVL